MAFCILQSAKERWETNSIGPQQNHKDTTQKTLFCVLQKNVVQVLKRHDYRIFVLVSYPFKAKDLRYECNWSNHSQNNTNVANIQRHHFYQFYINALVCDVAKQP